MKRILWVLLVCSGVVFGEVITNLKLSSVSDFSYTMGGKQSVSITLIGKDKEHYLDLTIHRDVIKNHFKDRVVKWSPTMSISAYATWDGQYKLWNKDNTKLYLNIKKLDKKKKIAFIELESTLFNPLNKQIISFSIKNILIEKKNFDNFMKKIK